MVPETASNRHYNHLNLCRFFCIGEMDTRSHTRNPFCFI